METPKHDCRDIIRQPICKTGPTGEISCVVPPGPVCHVHAVAHSVPIGDATVLTMLAIVIVGFAARALASKGGRT